MSGSAAAPTPRSRRSWPERLLDWRDGLLASAAFRRRAAALPLLRPIARRRSRELFDLAAGFVYSQVLLASVRLRLFAILAEGPKPLDELAQRMALPQEGARRLLDAGVALRLVERRRGNRFGLGVLGAPLAGDDAVAALVRHHPAFYADLADPVALLRGRGGGGAVAAYWPYAGENGGAGAGSDAGAVPAGPDSDPDRVAEYSALMSASLPLVADQILAAYPLRRHRRLLDVGGGEGGFASAAAFQNPGLSCTVFDLPAVAARARQRVAADGLADRVTVVGGDFLRDRLPGDADVASLVRVIHDHDDAVALRILTAVRRALPDGGTLLLAEPMADTSGAAVMSDAYFGFYLLAMGSGRARSAARLTGLLTACGFGSVRHLPTWLPLQTSLLVARAVSSPRAAKASTSETDDVIYD